MHRNISHSHTCDHMPCSDKHLDQWSFPFGLIDIISMKNYHFCQLCNLITLSNHRELIFFVFTNRQPFISFISTKWARKFIHGQWFCCCQEAQGHLLWPSYFSLHSDSKFMVEGTISNWSRPNCHGCQICSFSAQPWVRALFFLAQKKGPEQRPQNRFCASTEKNLF